MMIITGSRVPHPENPGNRPVARHPFPASHRSVVIGLGDRIAAFDHQFCATGAAFTNGTFVSGARAIPKPSGDLIYRIDH
ncbi:hypothetical protein [Mesorhizobium sp. M0618]|uniref:hypothetical protein n=1 Tax=unclassified Mesorhizobium TaxID=325217 RepID=UPI00333580D6